MSITDANTTIAALFVLDGRNVPVAVTFFYDSSDGLSSDIDVFFTFQNTRIRSRFLPYRPLAQSLSNSPILYHLEKVYDCTGNFELFSRYDALFVGMWSFIQKGKICGGPKG